MGIKDWIADLWDDPEKALIIARHRPPRRWQRIEIFIRKLEFAMVKQCLRSAQKVIIGVVPEGVIKKYALDHKRVLSVTNGINLNYDFSGRYSGKVSDYFTLFYCGTVDFVRLEGLSECIHLLRKVIPRLKVMIVGKCIADTSERLTEEINAIDGDILVDIRGRQPYQRVVEAIAASDVCLCPYPAKLDIAATYPVKIFDYMVMGKPIVASSLPGTCRILKHNEDVLLFPPGNYEQMAECIMRLYRSKELRQHLSENAFKNVRKYDWDRIHAEIYDFIES